MQNPKNALIAIQQLWLGDALRSGELMSVRQRLSVARRLRLSVTDCE